MLKECGVDTDDLDSRTIDNPITWSEMAEIAEKCTTDSYVGTHIIMDHGEGIPYALEPMYISEGKDYISDDGTTADGYVNSDESVKTTAFLADLIAKGYANVDPITDEFLNGACATELGGSWDVATLEANATFELGRYSLLRIYSYRNMYASRCIQRWNGSNWRCSNLCKYGFQSIKKYCGTISCRVYSM